ncbi:MAG: AEC family transporter [Clostridia bacterium]|nr:AEC family transporter [Clostridia bacterium]
MEAILFALNATMPIVFTVAVGYVLKMVGIMSLDFAKMANKLVFKIFLPVMLFMNVYSITDISTVDFDYVIYTSTVIIAIFCLGIPAVMLITKKGEKRGVLLQAFFRSNNALIGIPLAEMLFGTEGIIVATVLTAFIIPLFNIFGVISLCIFKKDGDDAENGKGSAFYTKRILLGIAKNPLIWGITLGFVAIGIRVVFVSANIAFRLSDVTMLWTTMKHLSGLATPLALIALGGQFEFSVIKELRREIAAGTLVRVLIAPLVSLSIALLIFRDSFNGAKFAAMVAVLCTPVAVSSVPMAQEMGGDSKLAGQLVVFTTLFSPLIIFGVSFTLKLLGIF